MWDRALGFALATFNVRRRTRRRRVDEKPNTHGPQWCERLVAGWKRGCLDGVLGLRGPWAVSMRMSSTDTSELAPDWPPPFLSHTPPRRPSVTAAAPASAPTAVNKEGG
eukprot:1672451-Rhodomonas_salina.1